MAGKWAYITFVEDWERPVDPGWGVGPGGGHPDQGLPGRPGRPPHAGHLPSFGGRPVDPGWGWGGGEHPGHGLPWPGRPTDPGYGIDEGSGEAGQLPVWPLDPEKPEHGLPPHPGQPLPPMDPPPGTIWPPLPPYVPAGKAIVLVAISGVGYRYVVVDIPEHPEGPEVEPPEVESPPEHPDQGLPGRPPIQGRPPVAGQPLPPQRPGAPPPQPGQPLPRPPGAPPRPGQGLPPTAQPKR
jgi:hypothetical protein